MKKTILAAASALAFALSAPAFAAQDHHGGSGSHGPRAGHTGSGPSGGHGGTPLGTGGHHRGTLGSGQHGTNPFNNPFVGGRNVRHDRFEIFRHTLRAPHRYHYG